MADEINKQNLEESKKQTGVLAYLSNAFGIIYRGMPYGISKEVPIK